MERTLTKYIKKDLDKKIVLLSGPRQSGKTTLSKMLFGSFEYFNFDDPSHRLILKERSWDRKKDLLIFDELHKQKNWKSWVKGIYDVEGVRPRIFVTGSAKLETMRKTGDSLAGRFFRYRLLPFDIKEVKHKIKPQDAFQRLMDVGGFPEPFLENDISFYNRWKKSHLDTILRQDLVDLENVRDINAIETLIEFLKLKVGLTVSYSSLARDVERDPKTVKRWLEILENLYVVFSIRPFHRKISRSLVKSRKYYFYDTALVVNNIGAKFENIIALSLLKEALFLEDSEGKTVKLHFLRNKEGKEIDFVVFVDNQPPILIEAKYSESNLSANFNVFEKAFDKMKKIQLVCKLDREKTFHDGSEIRRAVEWLANINLV